MRTTKPYLIRAIHEWCTDEGFTPYLAVSVDDTTRVPRESVKNGEIVLNVGHDATNQLQLGNDAVSFQARFGGRVFPVMVPIERVSAIYARENGQGMAFEVGVAGDGPGTSLMPQPTEPSVTKPTTTVVPKPPHLTRIK